MVLQQGADVVVWGTADAGEKIDVSIEFREGNVGTDLGATVTADKDGRWSANLGKHKAGKGYTIRIKGKNTITFKNVAVGEVWICSGQSNMSP